MKCKYCQAELEDGVNVCPVCGKEQEPVEETPVAEAVAEEAAVEVEEVKEAAAPEIKEGIKATPGKIALAIVAGVVVLALLVAMVVSGLDGDAFKGSEETLAPTEAATEAVADTEPATEGTIPPDGNPEDVTCKGSYSVDTEELNASRDTVVAVIGDEELTIGELQIYYWESIYAFESELGSYASQFGLDFTQGLDTQLCAIGDISMTWQQYFLEYALNVWHQHQAVALAGKDAGYELTEAYQTELDGLPALIEEQAEYYGAEDVESWIQDYIGPGCTTQDFLTYMSTYYHGMGYLEQYETSLTFTEADVEAYFLENEEVYADSGITKDSGKTVDVRHILLMPEGGETGEDGYPVYTDEAWAACEAEMQKLYDEWKAGDMSEQSFADYAVQYSEDGNAYAGGIYEGVTQGYMVETFDAWCFDETRKPGDHGLVKTPYGYHMMYFVGSQDLWYSYAEADLLSDMINAKVPEAMEKYPMAVDFSAIKLGKLAQISG